jgi:hypothetical protein
LSRCAIEPAESPDDKKTSAEVNFSYSSENRQAPVNISDELNGVISKWMSLGHFAFPVQSK